VFDRSLGKIVQINYPGKKHPLTTARTNILARPFLGINRQALWLESCPNPLRIQQVLESKSKKSFFVLGLSFSGGNVTSRGVFA